MLELELENPKLHSIDAAIKWREALRTQGKKVVLTNGVFDLLHTGHLYYLQQARKLGDALIVAINSDESTRKIKGPTRPIMNEQQRAYALAACFFIDATVIFTEPNMMPTIEALKPDIYCKAGDYTLQTIHQGERGVLEACGAQIRFMPFLKGFSTTLLIEKIKAAGGV